MLNPFTNKNQFKKKKIHLSPVLVQEVCSLVQAVTSQTENSDLLKRVLIEFITDQMIDFILLGANYVELLKNI